MSALDWFLNDPALILPPQPTPAKVDGTRVRLRDDSDFRIGMKLPIGTTGVILSRWEHGGETRLAITLEGLPQFGFASGIRIDEVEVLPAA